MYPTVERIPLERVFDKVGRETGQSGEFGRFFGFSFDSVQGFKGQYRELLIQFHLWRSGRGEKDEPARIAQHREP